MWSHTSVPPSSLHGVEKDQAVRTFLTVHHIWHLQIYNEMCSVKFWFIWNGSFWGGGCSKPLSAFLLTPLLPTLTEFFWRMFQTLALFTEGIVCFLTTPSAWYVFSFPHFVQQVMLFLCGASFLNRARCTVITGLDTSKRSTQKAFSCYDAILELAPRPRSKHEKRTAGSAYETRTAAAADGVRFARVKWEINFLLTFESQPLFCVYPVFEHCLQTGQGLVISVPVFHSLP